MSSHALYKLGAAQASKLKISHRIPSGIVVPGGIFVTSSSAMIYHIRNNFIKLNVFEPQLLVMVVTTAILIPAMVEINILMATE